MMRSAAMPFVFALAAAQIVGCHILFPFDVTAPGADAARPDDGSSALDREVDAPVEDASLSDAPWPDLPPPVHRDYVVRKIVLPSDSTELESYGYDYNNDGKGDNLLGALLLAIGVPLGVDLQNVLDSSINVGQVILLQRIDATSDWRNATKASLRHFTGQSATCCASSKTCTAAEADKTCFNGKRSFDVSIDSPKDAVLSGHIGSGLLQVGPGKVQVLLPLGKLTANITAKLTLKAAYVKGMVDHDTITNGKLMGAISQSDVQNELVPKITQMLNYELTDSSTPTKTKDAILLMFDINDNKKISTQEVALNTVVKIFTVGDVDVDKDGSKEISAGVGFTAVRCVIQGLGADAGPGGG